MSLRRGSKGDEVRDLQLRLYQSGYTNLEIDGIFGAMTEEAVKDFQTKAGLISDGIAGPRTIDALTKGYIQNDGYETAENVPVAIIYPRGQKLTMDAQTATYIYTQIGQKAGSAHVIITAPALCKFTLSPIAAMNIYQQLKDIYNRKEGDSVGLS